MSKRRSSYTVRLFYSYSHKDSRYREAMENSLSLLRRNNVLAAWSDISIIPGQKISEKIRQEMAQADIMVFLLSHNFFASDACMEEWKSARTRSETDLLVRIPIILSDCPWLDLLDGDDVKGLPNDGHAIDSFDSHSTAWNQVYEGIKSAAMMLRNTFSPKASSIRKMEKIDFPGHKPIKIRDVFIFPRLSFYKPRKSMDRITESAFTTEDELRNERRAIIHGPELSGKSSLARHLYLSLVDDSHPVLFVDLKETGNRQFDHTIPELYQCQFNGDYDLWSKQKEKTLIIDNLCSKAQSIAFVMDAEKRFERIIVTCNSDVFHAFFSDDVRLIGYRAMSINPLSHVQQEHLIRKRMSFLSDESTISDGRIDQIETHLNSIITSQRIVPRFPFFVLSILQTYENFMPEMHVTSYGYCYYILIVANLMKAGIPKTDDGIGTSFNFAEHMAYQILKNRMDDKPFDFSGFVRSYNEKFIIAKSILNRLQHSDYGIITTEGRFRTEYMYYYFVGLFLSRNTRKHRLLIEEMCERSHITENYLTLLFIIHHSNESWLIEEILIRVMCAFDSIRPATLNRDETRRFREIADTLSMNMLLKRNVVDERMEERKRRDMNDANDAAERIESEDEDGFGNICYKTIRNNWILGQILRNKHGILERARVEEIIEVVADGGLRVVNSLLGNETEIVSMTHYLHRKFPDLDLADLQILLRWFSFLWTMTNVEMVTEAINHPDIHEVVTKVVKQKGTPAYDLIGYFSRLDSATELTSRLRDMLKTLLGRYDDRFIRGVLSVRTQHYMNTHRSSGRVEQSVCSLLGITYVSH